MVEELAEIGLRLKGLRESCDVTREEMAKSEDMGDYFRIPCDTRDLNYDRYFEVGSEKINEVETYHSHNTRRLDVAGMKELLKKMKLIRQDLGLGDGGC